MVLSEGYGTLFEGEPLAVSGSPTDSNPTINSNDPTNGYVLVIPTQAIGAASNTSIVINPGDVVSILSGRLPGQEAAFGTTYTSQAGQWRRVVQVLHQDSTETVLLMDQPLPLDPEPQYGYSIAISRGFVDSVFSNNSIDQHGTYSLGFVETGNDFGSRIIDNTVTGGDQFRTLRYCSSARGVRVSDLCLTV